MILDYSTRPNIIIRGFTGWIKRQKSWNQRRCDSGTGDMVLWERLPDVPGNRWSPQDLKNKDGL